MARRTQMEARLLRIRAELEEREYEELTKDIRKVQPPANRPASHRTGPPAQEV